MIRHPRLSFATLLVSGGAVLSQRRRAMDPRHPARALTPSEIREWVAEGEDGLLWGAWDIPLYHNEPLDRSNRETIDSEFSMSPDSPSPNARRDDLTLYVKVFDDEDVDGNKVEYDDPTSLPTTEEYGTLAGIAERMEQYRVLNEEDFAEKELEHVSRRLSERCRDVVRKDSPPGWPDMLHAWLARNDYQWDESYDYETGDVVRGLVDLGLMDPDAMRDDLRPESLSRLREVDEQIRMAERQWDEMSRLDPAGMERFRLSHQEAIAQLKGLRTRILFDEPDPPRGMADGQLELPMDSGAGERNREINERADASAREYQSRLTSLLEAAAMEIGAQFDPSAGGDEIFASARVMPAGRERGPCRRNMKEGKRSRRGE